MKASKKFIEIYKAGITNGELPEVCQEAAIRNVTVTKSGRIGLGFDTTNGGTIRLALDNKNAVWLCSMLNRTLLNLLLEVIPTAEVGGNAESGSV